MEAPAIPRKRSLKRKSPLPFSSRLMNLPNGQHELKRNAGYVELKEEEPPKKKQNCRKLSTGKGKEGKKKQTCQSDDGDAGDDEEHCGKRQRVRKHSDSKGRRRKQRVPVANKENAKPLQVITEETGKKNKGKKKKAKPVAPDQVISDKAQLVKTIRPKETKRTKEKRKMSLRV